MIRLTVFCLSLLLLFNLNAWSQNRLTGHSFASRSEVIATHGMAATSQPLATQIALDIMKQGGNAIDAAIAANAALGLMEPVGNGIGGDLFAMVWDAKTQQLHGLNASGRSPKNLSLKKLKSILKERELNKIPALGALAISTPGCVDGWFELHKRFGTLSMQDILSPAIRYAREGFPLSELIAYYWGRSALYLADFPEFRETYMPEGQAPTKGEVFKNPRLARTLERIAIDGRDAFYKGEMARKIVATVKEQGGFLSYQDLATHHSEWVTPLSCTYRGYKVWELPPNGQGIAALQMLNILEAYDIRSMGFGSAEYIHLLTEAKKLAFEDRARLYADPDFSTIPIPQLLSKSYATQRRQLIRLNRAARSYPSGIDEAGDTIYLTVADSFGNMVSLIQSNYRGMGSGVIPKGLGFMLQDRGELFSLEAGHPNCYAPNKRPFHTIIPAFVTQGGKPYMSFGVMGGAMQPQGHVQVLVNIIDFGMNLQEAGDAPRIRHGGSSQPTGEEMRDGGTLYMESGFSESCMRQLAKWGHRISFTSGGYGGYQAIRWDAEHRVYYGASESRKDGQAAGW